MDTSEARRWPKFLVSTPGTSGSQIWPLQVRQKTEGLAVWRHGFSNLYEHLVRKQHTVVNWTSGLRCREPSGVRRYFHRRRECKMAAGVESTMYGKKGRC